MRPHSPAKVLAMLAMLLLPVLGACSGGNGADEPAATTSGSEVFADLAVCPQDQAGDAGCPMDQSGEPLEASDIVCSTAYSGDSDEVSIRLDYDGEQVFTRDLTGVLEERGSADTVPVNGFFGTGTLTIPGGSYTCTFDDGAERASVDFESSGDPGPAAYTWTCDEQDTETQDDSTYCTDDTDSLDSVGALTCSTVLTGVLGQKIEVRVSVTDSSIDSADVVELTGEAPLGILVAHATLSGEQLVGRPGATVPAGSYRCEWLVGGESVDVGDVEVTG